MQWLYNLVTNPFLITGVSSWAIAQILKVIIHGIIYKKLDWERLFGDGGMPSGHSATVTSMAVFAALRCGANSYEFAIAGILAVIVCHDAMGVRREAGKHAKALNALMDLVNSDLSPDDKLKELLGHTPLQVAAGITVGILNALLMYFVVFA